MKLLLLLLLLSTSLNAATLITASPPVYFFSEGEEIFLCISGPVQLPVRCVGEHTKTHLKINYECTGTTKAEGYIKDCKIVGAI